MNEAALESLNLKHDAEREIARVIDEFQQKTGLTVTGIAHTVAPTVSVDPPKVLGAIIYAELK